VAGDDEEMQRFVPIEDLFKGRHFEGQIIILCVACWYTSFKLSLRDLVIMMADRGISVTRPGPPYVSLWFAAISCLMGEGLVCSACQPAAPS
jgi:hypothetical protein